jgi:phosphoglycerol transferase MdoB-like AlkP superfamily enzyme
MVSIKKWPWIVLASVLAIALWTFISVNTHIFVSEDDVFDYFMYYTSYILSVGVWVLTAIEFKLSEKVYKTISIAVFALAPFFCMQIAMILSGEAEYSFSIYFINLMFYVSIMAIIFAVTRSMRWSAIATVMIGFVFNLTSYIVNILRGTPLIPSDFLAVGTAAQVAENYTFQMEYPIVAATVITALVVAMTVKFSFKPDFKFKNIILPSSSAAVALVFCISLSCVDYSYVDMDVFDQRHANNTHGTIYSFYINVRKMMLSRPEGYTEEGARELLNISAAEQEITQKPNIIVIMNESLADLKTVGEFKTNEDYMPFMRSLKKNVIKGELLVSPFGGYTCNTEFEFLTGLSMGLLPPGSTPYLQYVSKPFAFALPSQLAEMGYKTAAIHPYLGRCWNRNKVYDLLGFDEFVSLDNGFDKYVDESDWEYVRNYISDRTSYRAILNMLEKKKKDDRMFIFNVTMQNHGGYTYESAEFPTITISDMHGRYKETEQYLSLVKESDNAFRELAEYLKSYSEPTIVLMFGDHQPAVEQEFFEELYGKPLSKLSLEELQQRYKVPFLVWSNYDMPSESDVLTSTNYLSNILLDAAKLPKSEVGEFTSSIRSDIPQINAMGHYDSNGVWNRNDISDSDKLKDYEWIEYYMLTNKDK